MKMLTTIHKGKYYNVEYSIVNVAELEENLRIGAETYHPEKLKILSFLNKKANGDTIGQYFYLAKELFDPQKFPPRKVRLLELKNMGNFEIFDIPEVLSTEFGSTKNRARFGDVVISRLRPYLKQVGFIYFPEVYTTTELLILRQKITKALGVIGLNYYLYTFLMTKWVQRILFWSQEGVNHPRFPKYVLLNCPMPMPSLEFITIVKQLIENYLNLKQKAEQLYKQAEEILLKELGLKNWEPKTKKIKISGVEFEEEENISIRMLSEVIKADRLDAEYWETKYDEFLNRLEGKVILKPLKRFLSLKLLKGVEVGSDNYQEKGVSFIRVSNITKFGIIERDQKYISEELYLELKDKFEPEKGEILLTKDATPGIAYVLKEDIRGIIASGIVRLKVKDIEKEYLSLVINSIVGQMQILKEGGGSIISHWKPSQIENLLIPLLDTQIQQKISQLIQQSFEARENSKKLLEIAKRAVEIYIEKDEEEGIKYAKKEIKSLRLKWENENEA
ncbi:MAG: hypothetical protein C6I01_05620 [Epsilonproteobacteria bacterium]|nr:hypothetical protein [Campylobacterota bacterium]